MSCYLLSINHKTGDLLCCDDIGCPDVLPAYKINKQSETIAAAAAAVLIS